MSKTFDEMVLEVLVNCDVKDKTTTAVTNLKTNVKGWLNDAAEYDHEKALWTELIENNVQIIVPANTSDVSLPGNIALIYAIRKGDIPLYPIDPTQIQHIDPSLSSYTGNPSFFINKLGSGFRLIGQYTTATTLHIDGKKAFVKMINDNDYAQLPNEKAYVAFATFRAMSVYFKDHPRMQDYSDFWNAYKKARESQSINQQANKRQIIPKNPWTAGIGGWGNSTDPNNTSKVPIWGINNF